MNSEEGTSWLDARWQTKRDPLVLPNVRIGVRVMLLLFAVLVAVFIALAALFASSAGAYSCTPVAWTPWKAGPYRVAGDADASCGGSGHLHRLDMSVWKDVNNWPDPLVCADSRGSTLRFFDRKCAGPFKRGKLGLLRGDYYTQGEITNRYDQSARKYLVPG